MVFGFLRRRAEPVVTERVAVPPEITPAPACDAPAPATVPATVSTAMIGPPLWQEAVYGMTPDQVRAARPDAVVSTDDRRLGDGAVCKLEVPHLDLAAHDYAVLFYFRSEILTQVTIATNGKPSFSDFLAIANAMRLRYGREVAFKENPDGFSTGEWLSPDGVNAALVFSEAIECLNINFQYRYALGRGTRRRDDALRVGQL